ncbi:hypothetical protein QMZ92_27230 [Streptomyces sp. HNM0645]|uniref:hypothetical protein n=1 Tax=Streptomyces sp. HNM0645 TaxID=2782343 RepID=UPI0024B6CED9|nr:hypothetical protein [Streptomyces sp. HNM0645]MDI9887961.1 hypothetical protein [Streptomyces sp. HNM0645]
MSARTHPRHHAPAAADGGDACAGSGGTRPGKAGTGPRTTGGPERREAVGPRSACTGPRGAGIGPWAVGTGLRWWALVPPVIAFSALFLLATAAGRAQAADHSPVVFLGWIQLALTGP